MREITDKNKIDEIIKASRRNSFSGAMWLLLAIYMAMVLIMMLMSGSIEMAVFNAICSLVFVLPFWLIIYLFTAGKKNKGYKAEAVYEVVCTRKKRGSRNIPWLIFFVDEKGSENRSETDAFTFSKIDIGSRFYVAKCKGFLNLETYYAYADPENLM